MKPRIALTVFYIVLVYLASQRHLWFDELYTFYIASAPSLSDLFQDLHIDLNPPLIYLAARACMRLLGNTAFAVRLPSMVGFLVASLCLYEVMARRLRASYGFLAVLIFWSVALYFATEARPYALILGFFGLAMLAWQRAVETPRPTWSAFVLAAAISGMMVSHFFAVFFVTPFLVAELIRGISRRRPDTPVFAALLIPCLLPFFFLRLQSDAAFPPSFQAGFRKMASYYYWTLHPAGWVLLVAFCVALALPYAPSCRVRFARFEATFVGGLLIIPIIVNSAMYILHGAFFTRYAVPTLFAYPLAIVALLAIYTRTSRGKAVVMSGVMAVYLPIQILVKPIRKAPDFTRINPEIPLVAASGLTFLEMDHYEAPETLKRLYYLTDRTYALKYANATIFEGLPLIKQRFPVRAKVEPFREFVKAHPRFLVLGTLDYPEDWLLRYLVESRAKIELIGEFPSQYKDAEMYVVTCGQPY